MTSNATIRLAGEADVDQIVAIYRACFPERVAAVFGARPRVSLIRDYLRFYLSWDPDHTWVCVNGDVVRGFLIAPVRYAPLRAAFAGGQALGWGARFIGGRYGVPWRIIGAFLRSGFVFRAEPEIRRRWGQPYIHGIAVAPTPGVSRVGIGVALMRHMLAAYRARGVAYCWGVVPAGNATGTDFHRGLGAEVEARLPNGDQIIGYHIAGAASEPDIPRLVGRARPVGAGLASRW